ncbi:MAG: hypothetical protein WBK51_15630, partial [Polaromonas sp.]
INRTEYLKETVRQGNGLDANRNLTPDAMQRGWDCLARFGERLEAYKKRPVGKSNANPANFAFVFAVFL